MENSLLILRGLGNTPLVPRFARDYGGYCLNLSGFRREFSNTSSPSSCQSHCNRVKNKTIISYCHWKLIISLTLKNRGELFNSPLFFQGGIAQFPPVFSRGNWPIIFANFSQISPHRFDNFFQNFEFVDSKSI